MPASIQTASIIVVMAVPGVITQKLGLAFLQGQQRFLPFNLLRNVQLVAYGLAAAALVLVHEGDIVTVVTVWALSTLIAGCVTLLYAVGTAHAAGAPETNFREIVRFGSKGLIGTLSPIETLRLDQIALALVAGPAALGFYVVGSAFSTLPRLVAQSVGIVAYPRISRMDHPDFGKIGRIVLMVACLCGVIVIGLEAVADILVPWFFGGAYHDSIVVTRILLVAAFFMSLRRVLTDCTRGYGWPEIGSQAELVSSVLSVLMVLVLGSESGATGAALGLTIGSAAGLATLVVLIRLAMENARRQSVRAGIGVTPIPVQTMEVED